MPQKEKRITTLIYKSMILPLSLSLRKKNSLSTRTTHREELEYLGVTLGELIEDMLEVTDYERELLIECIQFRLETDKTANSNEILREELEELLFKVEETDDYV